VAGLDNDLPFMRSPGTKTAEQVAEAAYSGMMSGRRVVIPGGLNKVGAHAGRIAPRRAVLSVIRRVHPPDS
jgi:short-subunit dehydrogenase